MNNDAIICSVDCSKLERDISALSRMEQRDIILKALRKGADILAQEAKQNLVERLGLAATSKRHHKKSMLEGVRVRYEKDYGEVMVTIFPDYRLKWFEKGTRERYLLRTGAKDRERGKMSNDRRRYYRKKGKETHYKKGGYRGSIRAYNFFRDARNNEGVIMDAIMDSIKKSVENIVK